MKNLLQSWDELPAGWPEKNTILFLDYDGTLAPIAATPAEATLPAANKQLLEALAKVPSCQVVIISGRALADVRRTVGVDGLDYIGNHGWEIGGPHIRFETPLPPETVSALEHISCELSAKLSHVEGVLLEDKGVTLSLHYRRVKAGDTAYVKNIFKNICAPYQRKGKVRVHAGKKVLEVKPAIAWDKGMAALWFLRKQQQMSGRQDILPMYIGDDVTDEDAFKALRDKGITVFVGMPGEKSHARYFLKNPGEVTEFLKELLGRCRVRENAQP